ncbi:MAG: SIR2 family NAD-dependent protein deacylase [Methyloligellaceae bacterium]
MDAIAEKIAVLQGWVREASNGVAFTGAGISTESGIPDFRSPGGFWTRNQPIQFDDFVQSAEMRKEAWRRKFEIDATVAEARPNAGHNALAKLVAEERILAIITQNIDNLHQMSGVPVSKIIELHGNGGYAKCLSCGHRYELDWVRSNLDADGMPPDCGTCGGLIKSATISFGQPMPQEEMQRAHVATAGADLFLALGSSLVVRPAADFPILAKQNGARLVIVNREPTPLDAICDLVIHAEIESVMTPFLNCTHD